MSENARNMTIIVTKGTLDWAYPPFILATTAAAMGVDVTMFFTFYGLPLLLKKLDLEVSPLGNPAMKMPVMGMHMGLPNLMSMLPGATAGATAMMKNLIAKKGVAFEEIEAGMDPARRAEMIERSRGAATYPQIFIGERHIGGCDDLMKLERAGELDALLTA